MSKIGLVDPPGSTANQVFLSNNPYNSNFDRNMDIKAAENKLNAKQILLNRYVEMAEQSYIAGLSENEFDRRVNAIQRNIYYLDDLLGFAIHYENEDLQERASDLIYKAQSAIDKMKEFRADLNKHENVTTNEQYSTVDTKNAGNLNKSVVALAVAVASASAMTLAVAVALVNDYKNQFSLDHNKNENIVVANHSHIVYSKGNMIENKARIDDRINSSNQNFVDITEDSTHDIELIKLKHYDGWRRSQDSFCDFQNDSDNIKISTKAAALYGKCHYDSYDNEIDDYHNDLNKLDLSVPESSHNNVYENSKNSIRYLANLQQVQPTDTPPPFNAMCFIMMIKVIS